MDDLYNNKIDKFKVQNINHNERLYRHRVREGDIVRYRGKRYVIIGLEIVCGGHFKVVEMIKIREYNDGWGETLSGFGIRIVKRIVDEQIDECELIENL